MNRDTIQIIEKFRQISSIPRQSKDEKAIRDWMVKWAENNGFAHKTDITGNLIVRTTESGEQCDIVLQGHFDMVCEKSSTSRHDFSRDPIKVVEKNGWLRSADSTSLGADNGIALAYMMQAAETGLPVELLFTVEEEIGLFGAMGLDPDQLNGKYLINMDSEDEGIFIIGCAGGIDLQASKRLDTTADNRKYSYRISVNDLPGGHSGIDINKNRPNAIKVLIQKLRSLTDFNIAEINGGSKRNAIPRDAYAIITTDNKYDLPETEKPETVFSSQSTQMIINVADRLPHGAIKYYNKNTVQTSCNLALISTHGGTLTITSSQRSFIQDENDDLCEEIIKIFSEYGMKSTLVSQYAAWEPEPKNSILISTAVQTYKNLFTNEPECMPIHAGLECGVIKSRYPQMQAISLGPNIKYPHSPDECIEVQSIENVWLFLKKFISKLSEQKGPQRDQHGTEKTKKNLHDSAK